MRSHKLILSVKKSYRNFKNDIPFDTLEVTFSYKNKAINLTNSLIQAYITKSNDDIIYIEPEIINAKKGMISLPLTFQIKQSFGYIDNINFRIIQDKRKTLNIKCSPKLLESFK